MKNIIFLLTLSFLFLFSSCKKEEVSPSETGSELTWEQRFPYYKILTKDFTKMLGTWQVVPTASNVLATPNYFLTFKADGSVISTLVNGAKVWDAYQTRIQNSERYDRVMFSFSRERIASGNMASAVKLSLNPSYVLSDEVNGRVTLYDKLTGSSTYILIRQK